MSSIRITEADATLRQEITNDIDRYLNTMIDLRRRLNSIVLINRLPPELLGEIFSLCQDHSWNLPWSDRSNYLRVKEPLRWIFITGVCHHWREVALRTLKLWAPINLDYPTFARELSLTRAKSLPLQLTANWWSTSQAVLFDEIAPNFCRVQSIDIRFLPCTIASGTFNKIPTTMSPLKSIRIINKHHSSHTFANIFGNCHFTAIQKLELEGCVARLPSCLLGSTLNQLILRTDSVVFLNPVTFVSCLSQMTQLETLHIRGVSFREKETKRASDLFTQKVPLSSLRQLTLESPRQAESDYISFLKNLELPSHTKIRLKFPTITTGCDISALISATMELFRPTTFQSLSLCDTIHAFAIGLWEDTIDRVTDTREPDPPFGLWLPRSFQHRRIVWDGFLHTIYLHCVETLHFGNLDDTRGAVDDWKRLLLTCHHVKNLSLRGECTPTVLELLHGTEEIKLDEDDSFSQLVMPELETIHISDYMWCSMKELRAGECGQFTEDFESVIKERESAGFPIEKVVIRGCQNMDENEVDALKQAGVAVEWDGYVYVVEPSECGHSDDDEEDHYEVQPEDLFEDDLL